MVSNSSLIPNIIIMRETVAIAYKNSLKKQPQQLFQLFTNFLYGEHKISYRVCAGYYTNSNSSRTESHNNIKVEKRQYLTLTTQNCQLTLKKAIFDICARKRISNANNNEEHTCEWRKTTENLRWIWEQEEYILYRYVAYVLLCTYMQIQQRVYNVPQKFDMPLNNATTMVNQKPRMRTI